MIEVFKKDSLGSADYGWLKPRYHFSFSGYYNKNKFGIGPLRVLNDDLIKAGYGFNTHPHNDMEIITYIIDGELTHKDSMGNTKTIDRGSVQYMSAGSGITHSEYNYGKDTLRLLQIWIRPTENGLVPSYGDKVFSYENRHNKLLHIVSSVESDGAIKIYQDANIFVSEIDKGKKISFDIGKYENIYFVQIEGTSQINNIIIKEGDGMLSTESLNIKAIEKSHFLLIQM